MRLTDPRTPETLEWLALWPPRDRLAMMVGRTNAYCWLRRDKDWRAGMAAIHDELR